ncbi:MAG: DUF4238 domain-containing protein [Sedimentisphaerales bacterium]|nr:DUF4238 domain-containing protein [Sedimentisphaerales bacterium]
MAKSFSNKSKKGQKQKAALKAYKKRKQRAVLKTLNIPRVNPKDVRISNHYVPQWYQKKFLKSGHFHFFYVDLDPEIGIKPNGEKYKKRECLRLGPASCFKQEHLYTIELFGKKNDVIEKQLFGSIDARGSGSFDIFLGPNAWKQEKINDKFNSFIEFMDAQKLRTPKGLNFIKSLCIANRQTPNNMLALSLMQKYRTMHCVMWIESVWEVVSAEKSKVKFIINDHPVVTYNNKLPPPLKPYNMNIDPAISLLGTHTIYPLNLNHCLILTHRQFALNAEDCDPLKERINVRYHDKTIFKYDNVIYGRNLSAKEVSGINFIIKKSANRYIAAYEKEWLYPEDIIGDANWGELNKILFPPKSKIVLTQGIAIGHKDGSIESQDQFGRVSSEKEIWAFRKTRRLATLGKELSDILEKSSMSDLHSQNITLLDSIHEIFGVNKGKTISDIRKEINGRHVRLVYEIIAEIWPYIIKYTNLLPQKDSKFRGLYLGDIRPRIILREIVTMLQFFEEVLIINPFWNPNYIRTEHSPVCKPDNYRREVYKLVLSLLLIEPFIRQGIVKIIPAPDEFNFELKIKLLRIAEERKNKVQIDLENSQEFIEQCEQVSRVMPDEYLKRLLMEAKPELTEESISKVLEYRRKKAENDLSDLYETLEKSGPQFLISRSGLSLEGTLLFCMLTGTIPFTSILYKYKELFSIANNGSGCRKWNPLIKILQQHNFLFDNIGLGEFADIIRHEEILHNFQNYLKEIKKAIIGNAKRDTIQSFCERFLNEQQQQYMQDWNLIKKIFDEWKKRQDNQYKFENVFSNGKVNLILGDLNMPRVRYIAKTYFPQTSLYNQIPMAIYVDYQANKPK